MILSENPLGIFAPRALYLQSYFIQHTHWTLSYFILFFTVSQFHEFEYYKNAQPCILFYSAQVHESLEHTKFENDIKDHPALPELQLLQNMNTNSSDPTTIVEKDRLISEAIQQLQKFREQLIQEHRQQNKVKLISDQLHRGF